MIIPGPPTIAPFLRRQIFEKIWSLYSGASTLRAWRDLESSQWLDGQTIQERQLKQLRSLLKAAYTNNRFYRARFDQAGVDPDAVQSLDDIRRIPILTKAEVRSQGESLLSKGFDRTTLMQAKTGGSTGKPIEVFFTEQVSQLRNASGRRNKRWAGWEVGEPTGAVWGNPVEPETLRARLRKWVLEPSITLDTMSLTPESVLEFARQWAVQRPTLLFGHAHSLFALASMVRDLNVTEIRPQAIIPTSMMLIPHERRVIENVFGVKATNIYGCEEVGLIAGECERHEGLHINSDQLIVEILREDGEPAGRGEIGLVVVTDLLNLAMPFIRYRMEDMAEVSRQPCSCGRPFPVLSRIVGRTADFLRRTDGSRVAGISLIENSLTRIPGIDQMQIVQEALDRIVLRVVPGSTYATATFQELVGYFQATFPGADIELHEIDSIPPEPNGKYRFSICRLTD
jgi:phenylacetate-CoA ligase